MAVVGLVIEIVGCDRELGDDTNNGVVVEDKDVLNGESGTIGTERNEVVCDELLFGGSERGEGEDGDIGGDDANCCVVGGCGNGGIGQVRNGEVGTIGAER